MGSPKQLLRIGDSTLLNHAVECALAAQLGPVFVVLGANADQIAPELKASNAILILNASWKQGMHTTIRSGIQVLEQSAPNCDAVILMGCDQPHVSPANLQALAGVFDRKMSPAVASQYAGTLGTPALFSRKLFEQLKALKSGGAKTVLNELGAAVQACDLAGGEIDLDTMAEYAAYAAKLGAEKSIE